MTRSLWLRLLAALTTTWALGAAAQAQFTQIVFIPPTPLAGMSFEADVPAWQCFLTPTPPFGATTISVSGNTVSIAVVNFSGGSCFAAGDPLVLKPMRIRLPPLAPGDYNVRYDLSGVGQPPLTFTATLSVIPGA